MIERQTDAELRVLILAPTGRDAQLASGVLGRAGIMSTTCADARQFIEELHRGAGAALIAEEALDADAAAAVREVLARQEPWSDLPMLFMSRSGTDSAAAAIALELMGNVTVLDRPMRVTALVSAVRAALRARQRQYQTRQHLIEREHIANELRTSNRLKDEFVATLAHELRNPLSPISNSLPLLRRAVRGDAGGERVAEMLDRQVQHMIRLVNDLLEVSRITRGKIDLKKEPVELSQLLRNAIETVRPVIDAARHELVVSLPNEPIIVEGDHIRLEQIFANLLNNAAKYTPAGGQIRVSATRDQRWAIVSVRDNGIGIPVESLPRVFEMFVQVTASTSRAQGGLGIGLTLVKSLVEMHGGCVEARSEGRDKGSEFTVRLPVSSKSVAATAVSATGELKSERRVLVVDDNVDAAESLGMLLSVLGAQVRVVHCGLDALATMKSYRPDVVLLDIGMPEMDGYEVARRIREQRDFDNVTLIALTGWGQDEDRKRTHAAGFDHHLLKPPDMTALESLLQ